MNNSELSIPDQYDCAVVLYEYQDIIKTAYQGFLPGFYKKAGHERIQTVISLGAVLNSDHTLCVDFRRVIDSVLDGRDLATLTIDDFQKIAWRSAEWLRIQRLSGAWSSAAYDTRSHPMNRAGRN